MLKCEKHYVRRESHQKHECFFRPLTWHSGRFLINHESLLTEICMEKRLIWVQVVPRPEEILLKLEKLTQIRVGPSMMKAKKGRQEL